MVRAQNLKASLVACLAVVTSTGCSSEPSNACSGQGLRDVDSVVVTLIEAAQEGSVDRVCPVLDIAQPRGEISILLNELRTSVESDGGFDSLESSEIDQMGAEHIVALRGEGGKTIGRISVEENARRFFWVPAFNRGS